MRKAFALILAVEAALIAAEVPPPQVPDSLKVPETERVQLKAVGRGKQIYACKAKAGSETDFEWVLARPQADLFDNEGVKIGTHYAGPTWESTDGSKVTGQVQERASSPIADAVPWLLLKAKANEGSGTFGHVTYIQRVNTIGGAAPAGGCEKAHAGAEAVIAYQADYYFYGPRQ